MKVICKKRDSSGYYSNITVDKEYESIPNPSGHDLGDVNYSLLSAYYIIIDDVNNCKGYYLKDYFYSTEEIRQQKLDQLIDPN